MIARRLVLRFSAIAMAFIVGASSAYVTAGNSATPPDHAVPPNTLRRNSTPPDTQPRTLAPYFNPATAKAKSVDAEGFLRRWMLLEPIPNQLRSNAGFTEAFVRNALQMGEIKVQTAVVPRAGERLAIKGQEFLWHALDSALFNVKLFRFAYGLNKPIYGVTFLVCTVVDSPRELKDIRIAVGSNGASLWWVNGDEAVGLFGDRRMVVDDCVSRRLTLHKGRNVVRGAVINGPGMSDFCVRFLDENGEPVKDLTQEMDVSDEEKRAVPASNAAP